MDRGDAGLPAVHVGLHGHAQGRDGHARQPAPQLAQIAGGFEHTDRSSVAVSWLPLFHDMGLIGGDPAAAVRGRSPACLMSPAAFLQRPLRWLQAISRYGPRTAAGPNFAYDLCASRVTPEQRAGLDLARWRWRSTARSRCGRPRSTRFAEAFAPCGFRARRSYPATAGRGDPDRHRSAGATRATWTSAWMRTSCRRDAWSKPRTARRPARSSAAAGPRRTAARHRGPAAPGASRLRRRVGEIWAGGAERRARLLEPARGDGQHLRGVSWRTPARARSCAPATSASCTTASCSSPAASRT